MTELNTEKKENTEKPSRKGKILPLKTISETIKVGEMINKLDNGKIRRRNYTFYVLAINTGVEIDDLCRFKVSDIKGRKSIDYKGQKIALDSGLREIIKRYIKTNNLKTTDYLFPSVKSGRPISRITVYKFLKKAGKELGLSHFSGTSLRKTYAYLVYKYSDLATATKLLGFKSTTDFLHYIGEEDSGVTVLIGKHAGFRPDKIR